MKHIIKFTEPSEFSDWKKKDKMFKRGKANWNRVPQAVRSIIKESLKKEQGYICCYCEREILEEDFHTEHVKPKAPTKYPNLQLEYDNLTCSCQLELEQGEPRHCGNSKGSWFEEEMFVSPLDISCENRFKFTLDGHIEAEDENDDAAIKTITKLKLDLDKLNDLRKKAIEPFIDPDLTPSELADFVKYYLADKSDNGGKYNEFYMTISNIFK